MEPNAVASTVPFVDTINEAIRKLKFKHNLSYPKKFIIGEANDLLKTRAMLKKMEHHFAIISCIEPKSVEEALNEERWILAM